MVEYYWCHKCEATVEMDPGDVKGIAADCPYCGAKIFKLRPDSPPPERTDSPPADPIESPPAKPPLRVADKPPLEKPTISEPVFLPPQTNVSKSRPKRGFVKLLLVVVLAAAAASGWYYTRTPNYSLWKLRRAVYQHDLATFKKHFDVESVVSKFIDAAMKLESESRPEAEQSGWEALGEGLAMLMKPQITKLVAEGVYSAIETGQTPEMDDESHPGEIELPLAKILGTSDDDEAPGLSVAYIRKEGAIAYVGFDIEEMSGTRQTAIVKMRNMGGYWQVSEFVNAAELMQADSVWQ